MQKRSFENSVMQQARNVNIVDYLRSKGEALKKIGHHEYCPTDHDSLKINENGKGYVWNSRGTKGNALDFAMDYFGLSLVDAVKDLTGNNGSTANTAVIRPTHSIAEEVEEREFVITKADNVKRAYAYLNKTRGISKETLTMCLEKHLLSQDLNGNVVFRWLDENGNIVGANLKGTMTDKPFNKITRNNDGENCGFWLKNGDNPSKLVAFESPIDLLSFIDIYGKNTNNRYLLSLSGLKDGVIHKFVKDHGLQYQDVTICTDNDEINEDNLCPGVDFAMMMCNRYGCKSFLPQGAKDWNELLLLKRRNK